MNGLLVDTFDVVFFLQVLILIVKMVLLSLRTQTVALLASMVSG